MRAGVALGSNIGERLANLRNARKEISALSGVSPPVRSSAIYETDPVGCEMGAAKFFNAVIEFGYSGEPAAILGALAAVEKTLGRPAAHSRNVSRTIDLDLLYFGELVIQTGQLQLPHPRIVNREFVLRPLADIRPDLILPQQTESVRALLSRLGPTAGVVRLDLQW
ncbi:MAG TPA: 2-amino-4-hydroxy-6-hydroxymethyldihydropteridine diphosphokinase [Chthoniobacterales bacterium]|nr:2-amino-4-hydroxy-6-hydroxymethyldihydropteridine diphosphokinase [Chthoniobacterales bacterium]